MNLRSPFGRRTVRSVCIVTDKPVRLQAKSTQVNPANIVETHIVRTCAGVLRIRITATGEAVYDQPP